MTSFRLYWCHIPISPTASLATYRQVLRDTVFHAVGELEQRGLITGFFFKYDVAKFDLTVELAAGATVAKADAALQTYSIEPLTPRNGAMSDFYARLLTLVAPVVRHIHDASRPTDCSPTLALQAAVHYACNEMGLANESQSEWHKVQAPRWTQPAPPLSAELVKEAEQDDGRNLT